MIAGVDEAGRGPLAGPVVAASVILIHNIQGLNDSKRLTAAKRRGLLNKITQSSIWSYAVSTPQEIDQMNIRQATLLAMRRSVYALARQPNRVLVDGRDTIEVGLPCEAIIKGDAKESAIMAASIIAKEVRDQMMLLLSMRHPEYGFDQHAGYPTKHHMSMLSIHGVSKVHRLSYKPCQQFI